MPGERSASLCYISLTHVFVTPHYVRLEKFLHLYVCYPSQRGRLRGGGTVGSCGVAHAARVYIGQCIQPFVPASKEVVAVTIRDAEKALRA